MGSSTTDLKILMRTASIPLPFDLKNCITNVAWITRLNGIVKVYQTSAGTQDWTQKLLCTESYAGALNKIVVSVTKSGSYFPLIHKLKYMRMFEWAGGFPSVTIGEEMAV